MAKASLSTANYTPWRHDEFMDITPHAIDTRRREKVNMVGQPDLSSDLSTKYMDNLKDPFSNGARPKVPILDTFRRNHHRLSAVLRYFLVIVPVSLLLAVPLMLFYNYQDLEGGTENKRRNLLFYLFLWLETSWLAGCVFNILISLFPYLFRYVTKYTNPGHQKYWRVFRALRLPVTLLGLVIVCWISFSVCIPNNSNLILNVNKDLNETQWDDALEAIFFNGTLWACLYVMEKILVLYICIHYHYRQEGHRLQRSKKMQAALGTIHEASTYLYPVYHEPFQLEDAIIGNAFGADSDRPRQGAAQFLQKVGYASGKMAGNFGYILNRNTDPKSHWFKSSAPYAIILNALEHPRSSAALANRIWMSLVAEGRNALTVDDIAEVLGPHRREEAEECFKALDENQNGDIHLNEMVLTIVEAGKTHHEIYQNMHDINHAINTFDWIAITILGALMIFFILIQWVPAIKDIQTTASYFVIGIAFAIGRTVHEFLSGCIFIFFKHAYDVGDRVELYTTNELRAISCRVKAISVLYTVFERVDNGTDLQMANDRLNLKRVENVSRSNPNREERTLNIDFETTFKDIQYLKTEVGNFLSAKENSRDYYPKFDLRISGIADLNKLQITCSFLHKSNWSNEELRAARSSKFLCAFISAVRRVPIYKPGGLKTPLGHEGKPAYTVMITDEEAAKKLTADKQKYLEKRFDYVKETDPSPVVADSDIKSASAISELTPGMAAEEEKKNKKAEEDAAKKAKKAAKDAADKEAERAAFNELVAIPVPHEMGSAQTTSTGVDTTVDYPFLRREFATGIRRKPNGSARPGPGPY